MSIVNFAVMDGFYDEYTIICNNNYFKLYCSDRRKITGGQMYWKADNDDLSDIEQTMVELSPKIELESGLFDDFYLAVSEYNEKQWTEDVHEIDEIRRDVEKLENKVLLSLFRNGKKDYVKGFLRNRREYKNKMRKLGRL